MALHLLRRSGSLSDNSAMSSDYSDWGSLAEDNLGSIKEKDENYDSFTLDDLVTEYDRSQIESFFGGLGTQIYVSSSLANLYENIDRQSWRLVYTGIPVLLFDKGGTRSRCAPKIQLVLAERGTCFALWRDTIDNLSDYKVAAEAFHTMYLSQDHRKKIGLSFDSKEAADELWLRIRKLTSDPENISLTGPVKKAKGRSQSSSRKPSGLTKSQISQPIQFNHVTNISKKDSFNYFSLQAFLAPLKKNRFA